MDNMAHRRLHMPRVYPNALFVPTDKQINVYTALLIFGLLACPLVYFDVSQRSRCHLPATFVVNSAVIYTTKFEQKKKQPTLCVCGGGLSIRHVFAL